jgi:adenylate cyclase
MERGHLSRKLAVILHADVVGSTSLVQKYETLAHQRIQGAFDRFSESIRAYGGITHELRGDALVAEFDRASDAVIAALVFQDHNERSNATLDDGIQPQLRIGISLGEVVIADNTLTGAGVVLAQRLEQLAEPGGVVVQGSVSETVPDRMPFDFESLGEQKLKGFDQPVRAFAVKLRSGEELPGPEANATPRTVEPKELKKPDKPSIAVLPFTNMSGDPEQDYLADGICEDIITALSKIRVFTVIARNSSFSYKGQSVDVKQVAIDLNVNYVLEGSLRRSGERVRITAQLIDHNGLHIWAEKYDRVIEDIFELQDEMTQTIAGALEPELHAVERERAARKPPENLDAWECYQRGLWNMWQYESEKMIAARDLFQKAVDLDPDFSTAYACQSYCNYSAVVLDFLEEPDRLVEEGKLLAKKALEIDPRDPFAYFAMGRILMMLGDHDSSIAALKYSLELNPNFAQSYYGLGLVLALSGELDEAREKIKTAIRLSPRDPLMVGFTNVLGMVCIMASDFEEGLDWTKRSLRMPTPVGYWNHATLASAYANLGQMEEATEALKGAIKEKPDLSISFLEKVLPTRHKDGLGVYFSGLRLAGLPE